MLHTSCELIFDSYWSIKIMMTIKDIDDGVII